ncbi:hypothetical protein TSUD_397210 [Trifolium subterraneum]|uniref:Protein kinase domain-containing protein n=1 Tax=Trifolium subterraneum TaxID=3900 RepID=A0A2Z6NC36_TRISU|nr:hypothetical protein TSUD_397210 [Trifolium subterraneum]
MYAKCGKILLAQSVFDGICRKDVISWTCMIDAYGRNGCGHEAIELFQKMTEDSSEVLPNSVTFLSVLSACDHSGLVEEGKKCFNMLSEKYGIDPEPEHYACFIDILGRAGKIKEVWSAYQNMIDQGTRPTAGVWIALLNACRLGQDFERGEFAAKHLLELEPDKASNFVLVSNFYAASGRWDCVDKLRSIMRTKGLVKEAANSWVGEGVNGHARMLKKNQLNGTLDIGKAISDQLGLLDLQYNSIANFDPQIDASKVEIILVDNPACQETGVVKTYCSIVNTDDSYTTPLNKCFQYVCKSTRAPSFSYLGNNTVFAKLELTLVQFFKSHKIPVDSVSLSNPRRSTDKYLDLTLEIFPSGQDFFNRTSISGIGFMLSNQTFKPPPIFGPFYFIGDTYEHYLNDSIIESSVISSKSSNIGIIAGAAIGCCVLVLLLLLAVVYGFRQKNKAKRATKKNNLFEQWGPDESNNSIPQLKGARRFSFEEIQNYTKNFSQLNLIGSGGYGKVYRGTLHNGQVIAVKRAQNESMQGGLEFKTEIELLSRVHHKNLVSLVGFCFEQGEQILVYEYVVNGTLTDALSEYYMTQQLTEKSDVYSFGVLMLELITARMPIERGKYIVKTVMNTIDKTKELYGLEEILDPVIDFKASLKSFEKFMDFTMKCVEESSSKRPSMNYALKEIENMLLAGENPNAEPASNSSNYNTSWNSMQPYYDNEDFDSNVILPHV